MTDEQPRAVRTREASSGYLFQNPDTGTEWNISHPVESGECEDATDIRHATFPHLISQLQEAWLALTESEIEWQRRLIEAEARGAAEQRRKDAEGGEAIYMLRHDDGSWWDYPWHQWRDAGYLQEDKRVLYSAPQPDTRDETIRAQAAEIRRLRRALLQISAPSHLNGMNSVGMRSIARTALKAPTSIHSDVTNACECALEGARTAVATPQTQGGE